MVSCYASHGLARQAWALFAALRRSGALAPDGFTFSALLRPPPRRRRHRHPAADAVVDAGMLLAMGALAHGLVLRLGLLADVVVTTALLDMYAMCGGRVDEARWVFDAMAARNVVSWNAMVVCYGRVCGGKDAVDHFRRMLRDGSCSPDELTLASVLSSCASMAAANEATQVHAHAVKRGFHEFLQVANAVITAYGKTGFVREATQTFAMICDPDVVSWSSMVSLTRTLDYRRVQFIRLTLFPYDDEGYRTDPNPQHLACLVDLLGRAGRIEDAYNIVIKLSCESKADIVGAFLGACKMRGKIELAKWAADRLLCLEPSEAVNYLLMSNAFAAAGAWNELAKVRSVMRHRCGSKVPGCSWIEIGGTVQTFVSNDVVLHQSTEMQQMMQLTISEARKEWNEDTTCDDPILVREWQ
ncbi:unnamed protein product [Miscanthus lutarioriparius]|uniref:Pentatricopeptide repeat-containing protein n=1 Tax=Miscanthus lutarioriparius TaxID=422564 RepID=A0A811RCZ9_9POAL|nr:unnamed protein product [Miscanthus lutarioriparius]